MKILVLAHALRAGGGRTTCTNILRALAAVDDKNKYCLVVPDQPEYTNMNIEDARHLVHYYRRTFGHLGRWYFDNFELKRMVDDYNPDVIWSMGGLGFTCPPCPQAVSIQNSYVMYDSAHTGRMSIVDKSWLFLLRWAFARQLPNTQLMFCQTKTIAKRLLDVYGYSGRIVVTGKAVSAFLGVTDNRMPTVLGPHKEKFKLFYVTRYYRHKGLEILVETMDRYREELSNTVVVITIEAGQHKYAAQLLDRIKQLRLEDRIINVGPLAQKDLASYFGACDCLVMPTRLESFSGTYLEAMHFGLPILTSNLDFAREICSDAALYFDPWDTRNIKDSILRLMNDPKLQQDLTAKGRRRLSEGFRGTWEDIALTIKENLERLVGDDGLLKR